LKNVYVVLNRLFIRMVNSDLKNQYMIENLSYKQTITIISQYETEGHSPLKVVADDFKTYVLKFLKKLIG